MHEYLSEIYKLRWKSDSSKGKGAKDTINRKIAWDLLVKKVFQSEIKTTDVVLDLGAGQGEFINRINCSEKYALDADSTNISSYESDVVFLNQDAGNLQNLPNNKFDVVFTSNFFEHLESPEILFSVLNQLKVKMHSKHAKIIIMVPNIRLIGSKFYDFIDHTLPLTHQSMCEALEISGFVIDRVQPGFFPYSARHSRFKFPKWMISAYLTLPLRKRPMAGQMLVIAHPEY